MKINMNNTSLSTPGMAGMGAAAWERDTQKVSMHPPLPEDIEHVQHDMELRHHQDGHHIVHRRHPEDEPNVTADRVELPLEYAKPLLGGKDHIRVPNKRHCAPSPTSDCSAREGHTKQAEPVFFCKKCHGLVVDGKRHEFQ